jgi:predicted amidophosphoribosyltransferase
MTDALTLWRCPDCGFVSSDDHERSGRCWANDHGAPHEILVLVIEVRGPRTTPIWEFDG